MASLAVELNDAAIAVAHPERGVSVESACAVVSEQGIVFGSEALAAARLKPRQVWDRAWAELSLDPLPRPLPGVKSAADLAHAQLERLWLRHRAGVEEVLLVVPASFDRAQLALLLGIAESCGMPVRGLVDAAVAASEVAHPGWDVLHLEAQLHAVGLSRLEGDSEGALESFQRVADFGVATLREKWAQRIGAAFVAQTRFDPFSSGSTEQVFFDALPGWLEALAASPSAELTLEVAGVTRSVGFTRGSLDGDPVGRLVEAVRAALRSGRQSALLLGAELGGLPGVAEALGRLGGVRTVPLARGAGALGALARADAIHAEPKAIRLVTRLPRRRAPVELPPPALHGGPTHVLVRGYAHPVGAEGLALRMDDGELAVVDPGDAAEAGPRLVRLVRQGDELRVEGDEASGVLVNGLPADGTALAPGDRVGLDGGGEVTVIALVQAHGA